MDVPSLYLPGLLRALRRSCRLSQRELAERACVPASTVARIESGAIANPRLNTIERLLGAGGCWLVIEGNRERAGLSYHNAPREVRDRGGRHLPAHLPVHRTDQFWWGWHSIAWPDTDDYVPEWTYDLRRRSGPNRAPEDVD